MAAMMKSRGAANHISIFVRFFMTHPPIRVLKPLRDLRGPNAAVDTLVEPRAISYLKPYWNTIDEPSFKETV